MDDSSAVLQLKGYRGPGRPRKYDSEDERRIARTAQRRVQRAEARLQRNASVPITDSGTTSKSSPVGVEARVPTLQPVVAPPQAPSTPVQRGDRPSERRGPGRPRKYETSEERRMARTFQTRARRERAKLLAIQQKQQIEGHLNDRENVVKDEDIDDTGPGSAPTATAFTQQNVGKTLFPSPPPREITASPLSLASPRPGRVNLPLISRQSTTSSNASTMIGPSTSSRRMSLQSILHPSNEDPMSKLHHATPPPTLPGVGAGLTSPSNVVLPPLVRSPYSSSPEIPRYPSAGATSPHSSFGNPPSAMNGPSPNLRLAAAGYPLTSPFLTHFNATTASPSRAITSLDEALAEVDRLRDMYKASFEYIEVLERANEELRRLGSLSPTISTTSAGTSLSSRTTTTNPSMSPISPKSSIRGYCR